MEKAHITMLAHTLKGEGLSCLFVMLGIKVAIGPKELSILTNYDRKIVTRGLEKLAALGLVMKKGRYDGWVLTAQGYQLELLFVNPENSGSPTNSTVEGDNIPLVQRSSSSLINGDSIYHESLKQLQLQKVEGDDIPLAELLVTQGCPRRTALPAIKAALQRDEDATHIKGQIEQWFAYCKSDEGIGINNPPLFVAAKIKNGEPAPKIETEEEAWYTQNEEAVQR